MTDRNAPAGTHIQPGNVTRPFQLLAAWLAGLILTNSTFLGAATLVNEPRWAAGALVAASIANTPIFLSCLFLLLTKFRAEMQEDQYYTTYLDRRFSSETKSMEISSIVSRLEKLPGEPTGVQGLRIGRPRPTIVAVNDYLENFHEIVSSLSARGVDVDVTFGNTNGVDAPPSNSVIAVNIGADLGIFRSVVEATEKYHIDGFAISKTKREIPRISVGAYTFDEDDSYVKRTPSILKSLKSESLNWTTLREILTP